MQCMCGLCPDFKFRFTRNPTKDRSMRNMVCLELTFLLFACVFILDLGGGSSHKKKNRKSFDDGGDTPGGLPKTPVRGSIIRIDDVLLISFDPFHFNLSGLKNAT